MQTLRAYSARHRWHRSRARHPSQGQAGDGSLRWFLCSTSAGRDRPVCCNQAYRKGCRSCWSELVFRRQRSWRHRAPAIPAEVCGPAALHRAPPDSGGSHGCPATGTTRSTVSARSRPGSANHPAGLCSAAKTARRHCSCLRWLRRRPSHPGGRCLRAGRDPILERETGTKAPRASFAKSFVHADRCVRAGLRCLQG